MQRPGDWNRLGLHRWPLSLPSAMARPIRATVRSAALSSNLEAARRCAPDARHLAVVKANAYGHGLLRAARAFAAADGFAVLELEAALQLRGLGFAQTIVLLEGFFEAAELAPLAQQRLAAVIHCEEQLRMLELSALHRPVDVFLKINTGMNRLGFPAASAHAVWERLRASRNVGGMALMTHFASADETSGIASALAVFESVEREVQARHVSLANSATLLRYPQAARGWTRIGIMLYGASPFADQTADSLGLQPAMTLESRLIATRDVGAGESIGYGATFTTPHALRMGVVACGYADGYPRHAPTGTPVLVAGTRTRTLGRVSMDMLCVDLTDVPDAQAGSRVVLWGEGLPVEEVAHAAGTISYELLCALAPRVPVVEE
jgi:alanine racemase